MGCGCNRNRATKSQKLKSSSKKVSSIDQTTLGIEARKTIACSSCAESSPTKKEKKLKIRICHKINRLVASLVKDSNFKCPLGKF